MRATERLLDWYRTHRRSLPWRGRSDPYEIWVAEVMLQQTRSSTVERYYEPFLERFPDLESLAAADVEDVLARWSGLGYYRRARQLHRAARRLVEDERPVPSTLEELRELPGIGPYTAAAIASLAFGVPEPVVDGNVERVLSRFRAVQEGPRTAAGRRRLREIAGELLDRRCPGEFNQALMELGALVCTPRNPDCPACPLARECRAHRAGAAESYPAPPARRSPVRESWVAVVVRRDDRLLMARRSGDEELLAGLWELPWVRLEVEPETALGRRYGGRWTLEGEHGRVRHSLTYRALEVTVHSARWEPDEVGEASALEWVAEGELGGLPTSSLVGKVLRVAS